MNKESTMEEKIIETKKVNRIKLRLIKIEKENLRTQEKTRDEMVKIIRKIIIEEVEKNY